ncbi:hypothetical protein AAFF_G00353370 [Aldrovandia affinis]|uniref:Uncharacterized protein n=1 Tax=Aldrovandia affinis TaxID=143900 RepID=A0AAD7VYV4_9TELE|nr:hypothetical protein AAFF_G00353370 [Aldrovandia affinis]
MCSNRLSCSWCMQYWDRHLPLFSALCLGGSSGRQRTWVFRAPPELEVDYLHRLQEWLQDFAPSDRVWIYYPSGTKGVSPKLRSYWQGPGEILQQLDCSIS